jgi:hypothetical protein
VTAIRPEQLLEIVVGVRQIDDGITMEQAGSIAAGHLAEVLDRLGEAARLGTVARHGGEQPVEAARRRTASAGWPAALFRIRAAW